MIQEGWTLHSLYWEFSWDYPLLVSFLYQGLLTFADPGIWAGIRNDAMSLNLDPDFKKKNCFKISLFKKDSLIIMTELLPLLLLS